MSEDEKTFLKLWKSKMSNFHEQTDESKVESLRFYLSQLDYIKKSQSDVENDWALDFKHMEIKRDYSSLMDSKTGVNNYGDSIIHLAKGFKNDSKRWKSSLKATDLLQSTCVQKDKCEDLLEYEKVRLLLYSAESKKYARDALDSEPVTQSHSSDLMIPNFDFGLFSLYGKENQLPVGSQPGPSYIESGFNQNPFKSNKGFVEINSQKIGWNKSPVNFNITTNEPNNDYAQRKQPLNGNTFVQEGMSFAANVENNWENEKPLKVVARRYPWEKLKVGDEAARCSSFRTASHQLALDKQKKYGNHAGSSKDLYGSSKRSLGSRGIKSKFIPPVKKEDDEEFHGNSAHLEKKSGDEEPYADLMKNEKLKNIEHRMVELIMSEVLDTGSPVGWDDIAGLELAKSTIQEIVVWPMLRPDIFTGLRGPPKGILLFGPPGTGKTMIGKCIASQSRSTFFSISSSSLTSKWVGEGEKMVRTMFAVAKCLQPAVIFIDEIDSLLIQRSDSEHESSRRIKTEFLVQLDGATSSDDERLLVIGATNRPQELDEAARRRLVKRLYIPLPEALARVQIVKNLLANQSHSLFPKDMEDIGSKTVGYSGADMANLCREAALGPIRSLNLTDIQNIAVDQVRPISLQDFYDALKSIRASVSTLDLSMYEDWNKQYGISVRG